MMRRSGMSQASEELQLTMLLLGLPRAERAARASA